MVGLVAVLVVELVALPTAVLVLLTDGVVDAAQREVLVELLELRELLEVF
jgi:hypothetical protein